MIDAMATLRRLPRAYYAFALVLLVGFPDAMLLNGQRIEHFARGLAITLFVLWRLARRGYITWSLLVVWNAFLALALVSLADHGTWSVGAPLLFLCAAASVALLLTPSMREQVAVRGLFRRRRNIAGA
jgi:hypothetical protein